MNPAMVPIRCCLSAAFAIGISATGLPAHGAIVLTGSYTPSYNGVDDPWITDALYVTTTSGTTGTMSVDGGSSVVSTIGFIAQIHSTYGEVEITGIDSSWTMSGFLTVGSSGEGVLTVADAGQVGSTGGYVGKTGVGTVTVTGPGSLWDMTTALIVGHRGTGTALIENGARINSGHYSRLGEFEGSLGSMTVDGPDSVWDVNGILEVGGLGNGMLNVTGGAQVQVQGYLRVDRTDTSIGSGVIHLDNGTLTAAGLFAGSTELLGTGTIHTTTMVGDAAVVFDASSGLQPTVILNDQPGQSITIHLDANEPSRNPELGAGVRGTGSLTIRDGISVSSDDGMIGYHAGSNGQVLITGPGSAWHSNDHMYIGYSGTGSVLVENGGTFDTQSYVYAGYEPGSNGSITVSGPESTWGGDATFGYEGHGALTVENGSQITGSYTLGFHAGSSGSLIVRGQGSHLTSMLAVGYDGTGDVVINDGGKVTGSWGFIANRADSQGSVLISGPDSSWTTSGPVYVGDGGSGTLTIENGASLTNGQSHVADDASSTGMVTVTGSGSTWTNTLDLSIGVQGTGTLLIADGGVVVCDSFAIANGAFASRSQGYLTVTGAGSALHSSGHLTIGSSGTGTMTIENGAVVTNTTGRIGGGSYSSDSVTVTRPGSLWDNAGELTIGVSGPGILVIENGGTVNSVGAAIHGVSDNPSTISVTGPGSVWNNNGDLNNYGSGPATIQVGSAGVMNVSGDSWISKQDPGQAELLLDNGTLNTGGLLATPADLGGTGVINATGLVSDLDLVFDGSRGLQQQIYLNNNPGQNITLNLDVSDPTNRAAMGAGYAGAGFLTITDGLTISSGDSYMAVSDGSTGTATITGEGSTWHIHGDLYAGSPNGTSTVNVTDGGQLIVEGTLNLISIQETSQLYIDNGGRVLVHGDLLIGQISVSESCVNLNGGTLDLNDHQILIEGNKSSFDFTGGTLRGVDLIGSDLVQNGGTLVVGGSDWQTDILGGYNFNAGTIEIVFDQSNNSLTRLTTTNHMVIAEQATTLHLNTMMPIEAGTYTVIEAIDRLVVGEFEHITGIGMYAGLVDVGYTTHAVTITLNRDYVPGDMNGDGFVGLDDLDIVLSHWNETVTAGDILSGDLDGDGFVGLDDLDAILTHWNEGTPPEKVLASVPEPVVAMVMSLGLFSVMRRSKYL